MCIMELVLTGSVDESSSYLYRISQQEVIEQSALFHSKPFCMTCTHQTLEPELRDTWLPRRRAAQILCQTYWLSW